MRSILALTVLILVPLALASAGSPFEDDDRTSGSRFVPSEFVQYRMLLTAGETVDATLTWTDADAWFELSYFGPNSGCPGDVNEVEENCSGLISPCGTGTHDGPGGLSRHYAFVAAKSGGYSVNVEPAFVPLGADFHVRIQVDDGGADRVFEVRHRAFGPAIPVDVPCFLR